MPTRNSMRRKRYAFVPERLVTDDLRSYSAAVRELGIERRHERGQWKNNRAENSKRLRISFSAACLLPLGLDQHIEDLALGVDGPIGLEVGSIRGRQAAMAISSNPLRYSPHEPQRFP